MLPVFLLNVADTMTLEPFSLRELPATDTKCVCEQPQSILKRWCAMLMRNLFVRVVVMAVVLTWQESYAQQRNTAHVGLGAKQ